MSVQIEAMELQWASRQMQEYVEHLREGIAKEMMIPDHLRRPETFADAQRMAWRRTEITRREIVHLINKYSWPVLLMKCERQTGSIK